MTGPTASGSRSRAPASPAGRLRKLLLAILVFGIVGTGAELVLIGHTEDAWQWAPLVLFAVAVPGVIWLTAAPSGASVRAFQALMAAFAVSGIVGQWLHYKGNVEFELEMYPSRAGIELVWEALGGATPSLAPGTMTLLGLLGLAVCYQHPGLSSTPSSITVKEET